MLRNVTATDSRCEKAVFFPATLFCKDNICLQQVLQLPWHWPLMAVYAAIVASQGYIIQSPHFTDIIKY